MGEKKARRDTGSKVGAAIVQCGEEEKEDDGRAEGEGTVLCRKLRGSQEAKRTAALLCAGFRVWVCVGERTAHCTQQQHQHQHQSSSCGTRSWSAYALPGQEGQGPGADTCPRPFPASVPVCPLSAQRGMAES